MSEPTDQPFATGGIFRGVSQFIEPQPAGFIIPRDGLPEPSPAIRRAAMRFYGITGPGDHFYRTETRRWWCNDCESDCVEDARCRCCAEAKEADHG